MQTLSRETAYILVKAERFLRRSIIAKKIFSPIFVFAVVKLEVIELSSSLFNLIKIFFFF